MANVDQFLYNFEIIHGLEWPSLTVEWLPNDNENQPLGIEKLILGTHTSDDEPNYLIVANVNLPLDDEDCEIPDYEDDFSENAKVQIIQNIVHDGEVIRARHMPQNRSIIATKTSSAEVFIFDLNTHLPTLVPEGPCNPQVRLLGHDQEGFGLSWNPINGGSLISGSDDGVICLWDVNAAGANRNLHVGKFSHSRGSVEDVAWHDAFVFGSVGADRILYVWDIRTLSVPVRKIVAHENQINSLAFHPDDKWHLATGSADHTMKLFDTRKLPNVVHTFNYHQDQIVQVGWKPNFENILSSCCYSNKFLVWDVDKIDAHQTPEEARDGPPELLFCHAGHKATTTDFSWNPIGDGVVASVDMDNELQIWQISENLSDDDDDDLPPDLGDDSSEENENQDRSLKRKLGSPLEAEERRTCARLGEELEADEAREHQREEVARERAAREAAEAERKRKEEEQAWERASREAAEAERKRKEEEVARERASREAAEDERKRKEEEVAQERAAREAALAKLREEKALSLGPEPEQGPNVTQVLVRFPSGERKERRFHCTTTIQSLYDFVDSLGCLEEVNGYSLVSNFPRTVYGQDKFSLSLKEVGFHPQASLFVESNY